MKKVTLLYGVLLAISATVASAAGVGIRWDNCAGEGTGAPNKNFACDANTGSGRLVGSFVLGGDLPQVSGNAAVLDIASGSATLPSWWEFKNVAACRQTALSMNTDANPGDVVCVDWAAGKSTGGIGSYTVGERGANTARIKLALAVPISAAQDLLSLQEYFSFNLVINNTKTVGSPACGGCQTGVCIVFNSIKVTTLVAANNRTLSGPGNGSDRDFCSWQGGGDPTVSGITGCPAATPTRSVSWGSVKALYR
jgi:hypothetical protein